MRIAVEGTASGLLPSSSSSGEPGQCNAWHRELPPANRAGPSRWANPSSSYVGHIA